MRFLMTFSVRQTMTTNMAYTAEIPEQMLVGGWS